MSEPLQRHVSEKSITVIDDAIETSERLEDQDVVPALGPMKSTAANGRPSLGTEPYPWNMC